MSVLPVNALEQIQFCENHLAPWGNEPASIGLTATQVTALTNVTMQARQAYNDAQTARLASKAATTTLNSRVAAMRAQASDLIRQIKAYAQLQNNPAAVYADAQIPEPAAPAPLPAPGKPQLFTVTLNPDGSVNLSWEAENSAASSGAFFSVSRKLPGQSAYVPIGGTSGSTIESRRASFTDYTVPASAAGTGASYIVQGYRGTRAGTPSDAVIVQFGVDGAGGFTSATIANAPDAPRLAA